MKYLLLSLLFIVSFSSCEKSDNDVASKQLDVQSSCTILSPAEEIAVVNSEDELLQIVEDKSQFPKVDFSRYTVLLVHGTENSGISHFSSTLSKEKNTWIMSIIIERDYTTVMEPWVAAYLIPKTKELSTKLQISRE